MNKLRLLEAPYESAAVSADARILRVAVSAERATGTIVRQGILDSRLLTSVHEKTLSVELFETRRGVERLTRDSPFLSSAQRASLDERGLIREGAVVKDGEILASIVLVVNQHPLGLAAVHGMCWTQDQSHQVPIGWGGATAVGVRLLSRREILPKPPTNVRGRADFELRAERELEIGDVLLVGDLPLAVSAFRADDKMPRDDAGNVVDLLVRADAAARLGLMPGSHRCLSVAKADSRAQDVLQSRATGPYSLITIQPLRGGPEPSQEVTAEQIQWLRTHALEAVLGELVCLKSDDLTAREQAAGSGGKSQLWQAIAGRKGGGTPESLAQFSCWLESLGLHVDLQPASGCVSLTVSPASDKDLVERSGGVVRRPETIDYRTYEETEGGLNCPQVFGSPRGRRRRRFGHIVLESAIVPILWRLGRPSLLETLLEVSTAKIEKVVLSEADVFVREAEKRVEKRPVESAAELTGDGWEPLGTGAAAVAALLSRVPPQRIPAALQNRLGALTSKIVFVPPADLRPLMLLDIGNFATHDANDLIRRVVNRTNRLAKLVELKAPQVILDNEQRMLQLAVDALQANSLLLAKNAVFGSGKEKQRLKCAMDMILQELLEPRGKRVDWCGRARVIVQPLTDAVSVVVPASMFRKLEISETEPILITIEGGDGRFIARLPRPMDGSVIHLDERAALELGMPSGVTNCIIHRPLGPAARNEARQLMEGRLHSSEPPASRGGWMEGRTSEEIVSGLAQAAATGERVYLDSPALLALGGTGPVDFPPDPGPESPPENYRQALLPPDLLSP